MKRVCIVFVSLIFFGFTSMAAGVDRYWLNPDGGLFQSPGNWSGNTVPGPADVVKFDASVAKGGDFTVYLNTNAESLTVNLYPNNHTYSFDLHGFQYLIHQSTPYAVDLAWGQMRCSNGSLLVPNGGFLLESNSTLHVDSGGTVSVKRSDIGQTYGGSSGELAVENGGSFLASDNIVLHPQGTLRVSAGGAVSAATVVEVQASTLTPGAVIMQGGVVNTPKLALSGKLFGFGVVHGSIVADEFATVTSSGGNLEIGDASSLDGFTSVGTTDVGDGTLTLHALSYANLGKTTTLSGGTLRASNGVYLKGGYSVSGWGQVNASIAAAVGSNIFATGPLSLGDAMAFDGVDLDGRLYVGSHTVTLNDRNKAVLGPMTTMNGGRLEAANGILLREGDNLVGYGSVAGNFKNQGDVTGDSPDHRLAFDAGYTVSGIGSFQNVVFNGIYSPGNSPAIVNLANVAFGSGAQLLMELCGEQSGSGYDQVIFGGEGTDLAGTLQVVLIDGFQPSLGDTFDIFQFQTGSATGAFSSVLLPQLGGNLSWDTSGLYTSGSLTVTPEPATLSLLALGGAALVVRRKKN